MYIQIHLLFHFICLMLLKLIPVTKGIITSQIYQTAEIVPTHTYISHSNGSENTSIIRLDSPIAQKKLKNILSNGLVKLLTQEYASRKPIAEMRVHGDFRCISKHKAILIGMNNKSPGLQ